VWGRDVFCRFESVALVPAVLVACWSHQAVSAPARPDPAVPTVQCRVAAKVSQGMVRLQAIARAAAPISGKYRFSVNKRSRSGTSQSAQSGSFTLNSVQEHTLTVVVLDGSAIGHYTAELVLEWHNGRVACRSP